MGFFAQALHHMCPSVFICLQPIMLLVQPVKVRRWKLTMSPSSHNRRGVWGDPAHASSVVNVLPGAGPASAPGRSIKRTLQLRYTTHSIRIGGTCGCRARTDGAKAFTDAGVIVTSTRGDHRSTGGGMGARIDRVNWGPSAAGARAQGPAGINHKPPGGEQRRGCGHSKRRASRTTQPVGEPRATGRACSRQKSHVPLGRKSHYGITRAEEIATVAAYKSRDTERRSLLTARLKPYWGKPAVRNFRGGRGNEVDGLLTVCHAARKGGYIGSHWPNHVSRLCSTRRPSVCSP